LISLTIEIEKSERAELKKKDAGSIQTRTPFGYWIITGVVDLDLGLVYFDGKIRNKPKTFMKSPRLKTAVLEFKS
jgi:hypothetical protein